MLSLISQKLFSIKCKVFLLLSLNQIPLRNLRQQISPVRNWDKQRVIEAYLFFTSLFLQPQLWEELEHLFRSVCGRRRLGLVQVQLWWFLFSSSSAFKLLKYRTGLPLSLLWDGSNGFRECLIVKFLLSATYIHAL